MAEEESNGEGALDFGAGPDAGEKPAADPAADPVQPEIAGLLEAETRLGVWAENQVELAEALGCDRKTIRRWLKQNDPDCPGAMPDGRYNITLWQLWVAKKGKKPAKKPLQDKGDLDAENMRLKNEKLQIENAVRRGELMAVDEVCQVVVEAVSAFVKRARGAKHTLAPQVVGVSVPEATKRIGSEIDDALRELSLGEWAKKKPFWGTVYATLSALLQSHGLGPGPSDT